ncbi:MAG TPA: zf-HC2 domain-containing protein [Vicinamibacterales bacterium]|jgi:hypothetical protein
MMASSCRHIRRQLSAFHDGELPVGEQIAVQAHLRECPACATEARDFDAIGASLRVGAVSSVVDSEVWGGLPSIVVSRLKAEHDQSFTGVTGRVFEDLHLVWAALGATGATVACLAIIFTIFYYATSWPAGSNQNPVVMDTRMSLPTAYATDVFPAAAMQDEEESVFALAAVVTREGRIANLRLVDPSSKKQSREDRQAVLDMLDAISKARFEPARYAGSPVAVRMVWLYAHLTVRGKMPELPRNPGRTTIAIPERTIRRTTLAVA